MKLLFISGAYSGATPEEVDMNIELARAVGRYFARKGFFPIIPHGNSARFERCAPDIPQEFWLEGDLELLSRCDGIVMLPGWERSKGAVKEYHKAKELTKPVIYMDTDSYGYGYGYYEKDEEVEKIVNQYNEKQSDK